MQLLTGVPYGVPGTPPGRLNWGTGKRGHNEYCGVEKGRAWKPGRDLFVSSMNLTLGRNPRN
jgi:hypothetical protein